MRGPRVCSCANQSIEQEGLAQARQLAVCTAKV